MSWQGAGVHFQCSGRELPCLCGACSRTQQPALASRRRSDDAGSLTRRTIILPHPRGFRVLPTQLCSPGLGSSLFTQYKVSVLELTTRPSFSDVAHQTRQAAHLSVVAAGRAAAEQLSAGWGGRSHCPQEGSETIILAHMVKAGWEEPLSSSKFWDLLFWCCSVMQPSLWLPISSSLNRFFIGLGMWADAYHWARVAQAELSSASPCPVLLLAGAQRWVPTALQHTCTEGAACAVQVTVILQGQAPTRAKHSEAPIQSSPFPPVL